MIDFPSDMPLVPLVASSLQRLKYSPSSHPYYGRISLYDQANNRFGAKALHHRALWPAVPDDHRQPDKRTMEIEVAKWSTEDVEFRACVLPERGFCKEWRETFHFRGSLFSHRFQPRWGFVLFLFAAAPLAFSYLRCALSYGSNFFITFSIVGILHCYGRN